MAEAILKDILNARRGGDSVYVDSAGTHVQRDGQPADSRVGRALREQGVLVTPGKSRSVREEDFYNFGLILAMDDHNLSSLNHLSPENPQARLRLLLDDLDSDNVTQVPDPYFGAMAGFREVYTLIKPALESIADSLLRELAVAHRKGTPGGGD